MFFKTFKQHLLDCGSKSGEQTFLNQIKRTIIDTDFIFAYYIFYKIPFEYRIALSRLRCSVHSLHMEVGRHDNK